MYDFKDILLKLETTILSGQMCCIQFAMRCTYTVLYLNSQISNLAMINNCSSVKIMNSEPH